MSLLSQRIKELRKKFNLSQEQLANMLGLKSKVTISNYENGSREPEISILLTMSKLFNISLDWLLGNDLAINNIQVGSSNIEIPILDIYAAAGINGYCNNDYPDDEGTILVPKHMLKQDKKYYCIKVKGKSMEPTLAEGSYIVISEIQDINSLQDGNIYIIITKEGIAYLKRIQLETVNTIKCISDNFDKFAFPDFYINTEDIYKIYEINIYITNVLNNSAYEVLKRVVLLENDMLSIKNKLNKQ